MLASSKVRDGGSTPKWIGGLKGRLSFLIRPGSVQLGKTTVYWNKEHCVSCTFPRSGDRVYEGSALCLPSGRKSSTNRAPPTKTRRPPSGRSERRSPPTHADSRIDRLM